MYKYIITWFDGNVFRKTKILSSGWYCIMSDCCNKGLCENSIIKIEKDIESIEIEDKTV